MANKIQIRFEAIGDKALRKAILELAKAQAILEKNTKNLNKANNALSSANNKATQATNNHARSQKLIKQRVEKNVQAFGKLQSTIAVYRNKLLLAAFAATAFQKTLGSLLDAYSKQESAERQLNAVLGTKNQTLLDFAAAQQQVTMFGDEVTIQAMSQTAAFIKDEQQIKEVMKASQDLATLFGWDLNTAAQLVTKTVASSTNALQRYGIEVEGAVGSTERFESVLGAVNEVAGGLSEEMAGTYAYEVAQLTNAFGDLQEELGKNLAPAITNIVKAVKYLAQALDFETIKRFAISLGVAVIAAKAFQFAMMGAYSKGKVYVKGIKAMTAATKVFSRVLKMAAWLWVIDFLLQVGKASSKARGGFKDVTSGVLGLDDALEALQNKTGDTEGSIEELQSKLETLQFQKEWGKGWEEAMESAKEANEGAIGWITEAWQDSVLDWSTYNLGGIDRIDIDDIFKFDDSGNIIDFTDDMLEDIRETYGKHYEDLSAMEKNNLFRSQMMIRETYGKPIAVNWQDMAGYLDFRWDESFDYNEVLEEIEKTENLLEMLGIDIDVPVSAKINMSWDDESAISDNLRTMLENADESLKEGVQVKAKNLGEDVLEALKIDVDVQDTWGIGINDLVRTVYKEVDTADWIGIVDIIKTQFDEIEKQGKAVDFDFLQEIVGKALDIEGAKFEDKLKPIPEKLNNMFEDLNLSESQKLKKQFDVYDKQINDYLTKLIKSGDSPAGAALTLVDTFFEGYTGEMGLDTADFDFDKSGFETWETYFQRMSSVHAEGETMVAGFFDFYSNLVQEKGIANVEDWKTALDEWFASSEQNLNENAKTVANLVNKYQEKTKALEETNPAITEYNEVVKSATDANDENKKTLKESIIAYYEEKRAVEKIAKEKQKLLDIVNNTKNAEKSRIGTLQSQLALIKSTTAADVNHEVTVRDLIASYNGVNDAIELYAYTLGDNYVESSELARHELDLVKNELTLLKEHFSDNAEMVAFLDEALKGVSEASLRLSDDFITLSQWSGVLTQTLNGIAQAADAAAWSGEHMGRAVEEAIKRMVSIIIAKMAVFTAFYGILSAVGLFQTGSLTGGGTLFYNLMGEGFGDFLLNNIFHKGGEVKGYSTGGMVRPMSYHSGGEVDDVPALLQEGEFVMQRSAVDSIGIENLNRMNRTGQSQGGVSVSFSGNVLSKDFIEEEAIPKIKDAIRRGADIGIS